MVLEIASTTLTDHIKNVAAVLGAIAVIIAAIGTIHVKITGPWIARPVAKAIKHELSDLVEVIVLSDPIQQLFKEAAEEVVAHEMREVLELLHEHGLRLERIENSTGFLVSRSDRTDKQERSDD